MIRNTDLWGVDRNSRGIRVVSITELWCRRAKYTLTTLHDADAAYQIVRTEIQRQRPPANPAHREQWDTLSAAVASIDAGLALTKTRDGVVGRLIDGMLTLCIADTWK